MQRLGNIFILNFEFLVSIKKIGQTHLKVLILAVLIVLVKLYIQKHWILRGGYNINVLELVEKTEKFYKLNIAVLTEMKKKLRGTKICANCIFPESMGHEIPLNIFVDLIELENVTVNGIFWCLISHLRAQSLSEFLKEYVVSMTCMEML